MTKPLPPHAQQEVDDVYKYHFAQGLDQMFETPWYSQSGPAQLRGDVALSSFLYECCQSFKAATPDTHYSTQALEARLVWMLAVMPRAKELSEGGPARAWLLPRIRALECLLTGQLMSPADIPLAPPLRTSDNRDPSVQQQSFWYFMGVFAATHNIEVARECYEGISEILHQCRDMLNRIEARDIVYSIAAARHYSLPASQMVNTQQSRHDGNDGWWNTHFWHEYSFACEFIEAEDHQASSQVFQAVCRMCRRAFAIQEGETKSEQRVGDYQSMDRQIEILNEATKFAQKMAAK